MKVLNECLARRGNFHQRTLEISLKHSPFFPQTTHTAEPVLRSPLLPLSPYSHRPFSGPWPPARLIVPLPLRVVIHSLPWLLPCDFWVLRLAPQGEAQAFRRRRQRRGGKGVRIASPVSPPQSDQRTAAQRGPPQPERRRQRERFPLSGPQPPDKIKASPGDPSAPLLWGRC